MILELPRKKKCLLRQTDHVSNILEPSDLRAAFYVTEVSRHTWLYHATEIPNEEN